MFLPTTQKEVKQKGWDSLDVILITGDSYIDSPYLGISIIGHVLLEEGYRVGIIAQPDIQSPDDITRLGEPNLFWGVSAGSVDSMIANYTALKKFRKHDDYTPGGKNNKRPDRATIVYTNLIKRYFDEPAPIVLGGIEASLRRIAHYDYWDNYIRRSVLFDAKADYLIYGMAERSVVDLANSLNAGSSPENVRGLCYISQSPDYEYIRLPAYQEVQQEDEKFIQMFKMFYRNNDPKNAHGLYQKMDTRYLIQNPPAYYLEQEELNEVYELDYEYQQHPYYEKKGQVKALDTVSNSIPTHRGCYGECNFCAISVHEGRQVRWRSKESILQEAKDIRNRSGFKGYINDLGGPTANMYGYECKKKTTRGSCKDKNCIYPQVCSSLELNHSKHLKLLRELRNLNGIKKVFINSGLRFDMIMQDKKKGEEYLKEIVKHHVSGQLKIAPEHIDRQVLKNMRKPVNNSYLYNFVDKFYEYTQEIEKDQYLTYYFIAAHPGCTEKEMKDLQKTATKKLGTTPKQVQIFTPTPSTWSSVMYYTEKNPFTGRNLFVEKNMQKKQKQKKIVTG